MTKKPVLGSFSKRMEWLERVSRDPDCRGMPLAVAVQFAARYFNATTGRAWPALATLAKTLTVGRRSVQRALDVLVETGHLKREVGGGGSGHTNSYWMRQGSVDDAGVDDADKGDVGDADSDKKGRHGRHKRASREAQKGRHPRRPTQGIPREDPGSGTHAGPDTLRSRKQGSAPAAPAATVLPVDWELGATEFTAAQRIAGWDPERAKSEFGHFCAHQKTKGTKSRDWAASWEIWCRNGAKFDQRSQHPHGSARTAIRGLQDWLTEQQDDDNSE